MSKTCFYVAEMGTVLVTLPDLATVRGTMTGPYDMEENVEKFKELMINGYAVFTHVDLDFEIKFNTSNQAYLIRKNLIPKLLNDAINKLEVWKNQLKLDYSVKDESITVNMYASGILKDVIKLQESISYKLQNS